MFFHRKPENINKTALRLELDELFAVMLKTKDKSSAEYKEMSARLKELYPLRETDATIETTRQIKPEVILTIAANLVGIILVVNHEQTAVITSKAFGMIRPTK